MSNNVIQSNVINNRDVDLARSCLLFLLIWDSFILMTLLWVCIVNMLPSFSVHK